MSNSSKPTRYEEIARCISGGEAPVGSDSLSPNVKQLDDMLSDTALISDWTIKIRAYAATLLAKRDDELVKIAGISFDPANPNALAPERKAEAVQQIRASLSYAKHAFGAKDIKQFLYLFAAGLQVAYQDFGQQACAADIRVEAMQEIHRAGYFPPRSAYPDGSVHIEKAKYFDTIVINPYFALNKLLSESVTSLMAKKPDVPPGPKLIGTGFEEAFHAYQRKALRMPADPAVDVEKQAQAERNTPARKEKFIRIHEVASHSLALA